MDDYVTLCREHPYVMTYGGDPYFLKVPDLSGFDPGIVALSLSRLNRFLGHTTDPYSVAEHCVRVAEVLPPEHRLAGLCHDAMEAFLGDVPSPLKRMLPVYREIEAKHERALREFLGLDPEGWADEVREADLRMTATEYRDLLPWVPLATSGIDLRSFPPYDLNVKRNRVLDPEGSWLWIWKTERE